MRQFQMQIFDLLSINKLCWENNNLNFRHLNHFKDEKGGNKIQICQLRTSASAEQSSVQSYSTKFVQRITENYQLHLYNYQISNKIKLGNRGCQKQNSLVKEPQTKKHSMILSNGKNFFCQTASYKIVQNTIIANKQKIIKDVSYQILLKAKNICTSFILDIQPANNQKVLGNYDVSSMPSTVVIRAYYLCCSTVTAKLKFPGQKSQAYQEGASKTQFCSLAEGINDFATTSNETLLLCKSFRDTREELDMKEWFTIIHIKRIYRHYQMGDRIQKLKVKDFHSINSKSIL
ncbi:unnamed protein product (macronuclear) [Paramecium tetraurelia]|uniref:Uncharacterized protein n=1 Tax=Paramecium tetraurelia TaxID=5888 RepID=A0D1X8_PARTE|nr:uncharacterized protein GSPATT00039179001 [Paramecium tetraurelia]CAK77045.1 unnamed protein product [Paramecium tetraurelia]|eukprot:XP_001444442.1 hypothetical protein (macronuclear) [Paramecium tetraurelia strain d4-2]